MKNVAVMSCALSSARIRGTPTSGPYDWWLMGVIRLMAEMSVVSMGASASMSKVRHAAALTPAGHVTGAGAAALLTRSAPAAGWGLARSALVIRASGRARDGDSICHARYRKRSKSGPVRAIRPGCKPSPRSHTVVREASGDAAGAWRLARAGAHTAV